MEQKPVLAVIGGSGLYDFRFLEKTQEFFPDTPFGIPSAPIRLGYVEDKPVAFLARHGIGHIYSPSEVNYRANIYALKMLGVDKVVSISACGSLREDFSPGNIIIPDQIFDYTHQRERSFFGEGLVIHVSPATPFCQELSTILYQSASDCGFPVHMGSSVITIEGPRFSTKAESNVYRSWGMSLIGMTTSPEAFLAKEAEMCFSVMAHVTDYDVWHLTEESVSVEMVISTLKKNTEAAQETILTLIRNLPEKMPCSCEDSLKDALITNPQSITPTARERVGILLDKYLK